MFRFKQIRPKNLIKDFYYNGILSKESVIESAYNYWYAVSSKNRMKTMKVPCATGVTDGVIEFLTPRNRKHLGWGLQEVKRGFNSGTNRYKYHIIQSLGYMLQLNPTSQIDVIILNSDRYFDYILYKENIDKIDELSKQIFIGLSQYSPSLLYKAVDINVDDFIIHHFDINVDFDLSIPLTNIYNSLLA